MQHQDFESPPALQDCIKCFWYARRAPGTEASGFEVVPDGYSELIFHFGNSCSMKTKDGLQLLPSPFMVGLLEQPVHFYSANRLEIIGVKCFPWTVFDLLGLPSGKDGVRTFEHPVAQLQPVLEKHIQAGRIEDAVAEIQQYFLTARSQVRTLKNLHATPFKHPPCNHQQWAHALRFCCSLIFPQQ